jgi:tRNA dimethylallyltransferase
MRSLDDIAPPEPGEIFAVVGPTASGKTELAIALAEKLGGEIIGADSVQIYRLFDVGSGKPDAVERARIPHHLVDAFDPLDAFDAARFVEHADRAIAEVRARGGLPVVCGGTFLWIKALLHGLAPSAPADPEVRERHRALADSEGRGVLHAQLSSVDPASGARLSPNDFVRVSRALEVYELTGKTQSAWHAEHQFRTLRHPARLFGLERPRAELDDRIAARTARWLESGWVEEVEDLAARGYARARAMRSVGYRQVLAQVRGELAREDLSEAIVRATRTFVRRQRTWLRDQPVSWLQAV